MPRKRYVPVEELKRQIDIRKARDICSIYVEFYKEVHPTWSKYPCETFDSKENCINGTNCDGRIFIKMRDYTEQFQIELIAIRKEQKTYIIPDGQYQELLEYGGFTECQLEWVEY
jgi:hypothetical protein